MLPFDPASFDDSRWPRLSLRLAGTLTSQGHVECLEALAGYLGRAERFALLVDLTQVGLIPLEQRWRQVEWFEEHEQPLRTQLVGSAIILTSPLVRLSVSAILHFKRVPVPLAAVPTRQEAEAWVDERLREAGLLPQAP